MKTRSPELDELLLLYGVQSSYEDVHHRRQEASIDSLVAVLQCLGAPLARLEDAPQALAERRNELLSRCIEPVVVTWDGEAVPLRISLPSRYRSGSVACRLETAAGQVAMDYRLEDLPKLRTSRGESHEFVHHELRLPAGLPEGYHRLLADTPAGSCESLVISAPHAAFSPDGGALPAASRNWGSFLPTYALWSESGWGAGDYSLLAELAEWTGRLGGRAIGTLPLLAAFLDEPCEPSPYAPASRLFWNELYIDVTSVPELRLCPEAADLIGSAEFQTALLELRQSELVEYRQLAARKRQVLQILAADFFRRQPPRFAQFRQFIHGHPPLMDYAQFRAAQETQRVAWSEWPSRMRDGHLAASDFPQAISQYHAYVQWIALEQVREVARRGGEAGCGLYLDLPLGVRPDGYDVWRHRNLYAADASAGAPPDAVFTKGQDWGFPPLLPHMNRLDGYRHLRDILAHHLECARQLRIDHIMGLHRLYWVPRGMAPHQGVYVRYRPEEAYAILCLESRRHRCAIVGEDLGTVPQEVNELMGRHCIRRMFVVEYELDARSEEPLKPPPRRCAASLDTHDMPPFAAWWLQQDIPDRRDLGLLDEDAARREILERQELKQKLLTWLQGGGAAELEQGPLPVIHALLRWLAASPAELLMINLENLWEETRSQNVPGTAWERPNWRRKTRYNWERFSRMPAVAVILEEINRLRVT